MIKQETKKKFKGKISIKYKRTKARMVVKFKKNPIYLEKLNGLVFFFAANFDHLNKS